jgi:hypothetical protein
MAPLLTPRAVETALVGLKKYRVQRTQRVALEGKPDGISGALLLSFGLRETGLQNIIGGLAYVNPKDRSERWPTDRKGGIWIAEWDPAKQDVGIFQISRRWHMGALRLMPAVRSGTWGPVIDKATAADAGMVPRFEDSLRYTLSLLHDHMAQAEDMGVTELDKQVEVAIAAHNAGMGGAMKGYREGNVEKYTTQGDYVSWVKHHRTMVNRALGTERFRNWRV